MKKFRLHIVLILLALVLATVPAALAQDTTLGASQSDYDLWTSANAASMQFQSVSYSFTAKLDAAGMGDSNVSANLSGTGVVDTNKTNPAFQLDVTGTVTQGKQSSPVNLNVRVVDGNIYYNSGDGWNGGKLQDVASLFSQGFTQGSGLPINPSDLASGNLSSLSSNPMAASAMTALSQLKPSDFLSLSRSDANGLAQFTLKVDVVKLLGSPALAPLFSSLMAAGASAGSSSGASAPAMTDAQMQQMQGMIGAMFAKATITFDQYIDPSSKLVQRDVVAINLPLDGVIGPGAAVTLNFDASLSNYNQAVTVTAPADAKMMNASQ